MQHHISEMSSVGDQVTPKRRGTGQLTILSKARGPWSNTSLMIFAVNENFWEVPNYRWYHVDNSQSHQHDGVAWSIVEWGKCVQVQMILQVLDAFNPFSSLVSFRPHTSDMRPLMCLKCLFLIVRLPVNCTGAAAPSSYILWGTGRIWLKSRLQWCRRMKLSITYLKHTVLATELLRPMLILIALYMFKINFLPNSFNQYSTKHYYSTYITKCNGGQF